jgi:hypothetical protein
MAAKNDFSQSKMIIIAMAVLIAVMIFSMYTLKPQLDNPVFLVKEGSLMKNTLLRISPGESYSYVYTAGNASANLTYDVLEGPGCTLVSLSDTSASICLDRAGDDKNGSNASYSVPAMIFSKPWMLAVEDGWHWNVSSYLVFDKMVKHISDVNYTAVRREYYKGRESYVVQISPSDSEPIIDWVDSDKRILLKETGPDYEVDLVSGLPLEN